MIKSCIPHDDVLSRTLSKNDFAAKLTNVVFRQDDALNICASSRCSSAKLRG